LSRPVCVFCLGLVCVFRRLLFGLFWVILSVCVCCGASLLGLFAWGCPVVACSCGCASPALVGSAAGVVVGSCCVSCGDPCPSVCAGCGLCSSCSAPVPPVGAPSAVVSSPVAPAGVSPAVVGFSGSRSLSARWLPLVSRVVRGAVAAGFAPSVGCCVGADSLVLSSALVGGFASRLSVLAAFGPCGSGACASSALSGVLSAAAGGASVSWWAGGSASVPLVGRLARRSAALARFSGGWASAPFVGFVGAACPGGVVPGGVARSFSGSGSGSWASLALAAGAGRSVFAFWCAPGAPALPAWPSGAWVPVGSGWPAGGWAWVPVSRPSLF
jgi:hypothetical protein